MVPLTSMKWSGLRLFSCRHSAGVRALHLEIETPRLVQWRHGGTDVTLRRSGSRHQRYVSMPGRFDFHAPGVIDEVRVGPMPEPTLVVEVPSSWTQGLNERHDMMPASRLQFADRRLHGLLDALLAHGTQGEPFGDLYTHSLSCALAARLGEVVAGSAGNHERPASLTATQRRRIEELLESQLGHPPDAVALARIAGMSLRRFLLAFRTAFGESPHQYVLRRRIERAKQLLVTERPSLTDLALGLGFASHAHFATAFHARTGKTPSAFRRETVRLSHA